jgi:hypothetical protein
MSSVSSCSTATTTASSAPRGRPPKPRDYNAASTALASANNVDKKSAVETAVRHQRRSKSEYRQRKSPSRLPASSKLYDVDVEVKRPKPEREPTSWCQFNESLFRQKQFFRNFFFVYFWTKFHLKLNDKFLPDNSLESSLITAA